MFQKATWPKRWHFKLLVGPSGPDFEAFGRPFRGASKFVQKVYVEQIPVFVCLVPCDLQALEKRGDAVAGRADLRGLHLYRVAN